MAEKGSSNDDLDQENGHSEAKQEQPRIRSAFRALIQDFSAIWVTWSMNLGILSSLMHTLPYQFSGLRTIAAVLYVADLVVFILCVVCISLRFII